MRQGRAEAEAIRLKLEAEAKGLDQKAGSDEENARSSHTEMVVDKLPEIVLCCRRTINQG